MYKKKEGYVISAKAGIQNLRFPSACRVSYDGLACPSVGMRDCPIFS
jgi:hypothetical protein